MNKDEQKALKNAGYHQSSVDANKWVNNSNSHWVKESDGGSKTFNTSRHNTYGSGMSQSNFNDRLKK
jgi:hypothetical protein